MQASPGSLGAPAPEALVPHAPMPDVPRVPFAAPSQWGPGLGAAPSPWSPGPGAAHHPWPPQGAQHYQSQPLQGQVPQYYQPSQQAPNQGSASWQYQQPQPGAAPWHPRPPQFGVAPWQQGHWPAAQWAGPHQAPGAPPPGVPWGGAHGHWPGATATSYTSATGSLHEAARSASGYGTVGGAPGRKASVDYDYLPAEDDELAAYSGISVRPFLDQVLNDVTHAHRHFQRSGEQYNMLKNVASNEECEHLRENLGHLPHVLTNMLVWRRSLMKILLVCMIIATASSCRQFVFELHNSIAEYHEVPMRGDFASWKTMRENTNKTTSFNEYSVDVLKEVQRLMMGQAGIVQAIGRGVNTIVSVAATVLVFFASWHWGNFWLSRHYLMFAWFISIAAPFFVSMVPARLWVDWSSCESLVGIYRQEVEGFVGFDKRIELIKSTCLMINTTGTAKVEKANKFFGVFCSVIDSMPQSFIMPNSVKFWEWKRMDMAPARGGCTQGRAMILDGKPTEALEYARKGCALINRVLDEYSKNYGEAPEVVGYMAERMKDAAEATIATWLAMQNLGTLFPAALSIAPGLLKGAMRMKLLVPQSNIPGMFVLILPWLYCPMTWCMYSVAFQAIGNPVLLIGLLIMAFTPVTYVVIGKWYRLDKPMTDQNVTVAIRALGRTLSVVSMISYSLIFCWFWYTASTYAAKKNYWGYLARWGGGAAKVDWGTKMESSFLATFFEVKDWSQLCVKVVGQCTYFFCSMMKAFYLTGAAGVDWMIGQMVDFRVVENAIHSSNLMTGDIMNEYNERMDQLVSLDTGPKGRKTLRMPPGKLLA